MNLRETADIEGRVQAVLEAYRYPGSDLPEVFGCYVADHARLLAEVLASWGREAILLRLLAQSLAEVERLRARTHELQERADQGISHWKKRATTWEETLKHADYLLTEPGSLTQSAVVRAATAFLVQRAERAEARVVATGQDFERIVLLLDSLDRQEPLPPTTLIQTLEACRQTAIDGYNRTRKDAQP